MTLPPMTLPPMTLPPMTFPPVAVLRDRVGDLRQVASIRLIELGDGAERGVRALALSSGGGLDFWVMVDRSFDIGPVWHRGVQVAWQSATGFRSPFLHDSEADGGLGFNRSFSGFLATCGLEHVRRATATSPQHGRLPFTPARLLSYGEDWDGAEPMLVCEGEVMQARYGGEAFCLRRRIEVPIGGTRLRIVDRVTNQAAGAQDHAILYHFNLGWPAIGDGTVVRLGGAPLLGPLRLADPAAGPVNASRRMDQAGWVECEILPAGIRIGWDSGTLPVLATWHDLRPRAGVLGIEPCNTMRTEAGETPVRLEASGFRDYRLEVGFG